MTAQAAPDVLLKALRRALRPFVRLMLAKGVSFPQLSEMFKGLYVGVADKEFGIDGKPQTDSRISLLTGIHRKDIKRLRAEADADESIPESVSLGMRLVSAWSEAPFAGADGKPQPLPRLASRGGELSFDGLVASVSRDIRGRAVLDEWLRLGVVRLDADDRVVIEAAAFLPHQGFEEKAFYFGHNLHDHAAAAVHNVLCAESPFVERSVHYDALPADVVARLARQAENGGMALLHGLNHEAMAVPAAASGEPPANAQRFTFGIYFYADAAAAEAAGTDGKLPKAP